jgi:hypothetical protein
MTHGAVDGTGLNLDDRCVRPSRLDPTQRSCGKSMP